MRDLEIAEAGCECWPKSDPHRRLRDPFKLLIVLNLTDRTPRADQGRDPASKHRQSPKRPRDEHCLGEAQIKFTNNRRWSRLRWPIRSGVQNCGARLFASRRVATARSRLPWMSAEARALARCAWACRTG